MEKVPLMLHLDHSIPFLVSVFYNLYYTLFKVTFKVIYEGNHIFYESLQKITSAFLKRYPEIEHENEFPYIFII